MKEYITNKQEGCPPLSFVVLEHIQHAITGGKTVLWDTKLRRYGGSNETVRVRGMYGEVGDKMDFKGRIHCEPTEQGEP